MKWTIIKMNTVPPTLTSDSEHVREKYVCLKACSSMTGEKVPIIWHKMFDCNMKISLSFPVPLFPHTHLYCFLLPSCPLGMTKLYGYVHKEMLSIKRDYGIWHYVLSYCIIYALWICPCWDVLLCLVWFLNQLVMCYCSFFFLFPAQWFIFTWSRKQKK